MNEAVPNSRLIKLRNGSSMLLPDRVRVNSMPLQWRELLALIKRIAGRQSILITGETGTGKELLAQYVMESSPWTGERCVSVNCAGFSGELADSELFGYEKDSHNHADETKKGILEVASPGITFLDELTWVYPHIQAKLLRFMQTGEIRRVGAPKPIQPKEPSVIIAASNKDVTDASKLIQDLRHRFDYEIQLPSLTNRPEDVPILVALYCHNREPRILAVDTDVFLMLGALSITGNIRELFKFLSLLLATGRNPTQLRVRGTPLCTDECGRTVSTAKLALLLRSKHIECPIDEWLAYTPASMHPSTPDAKALATWAPVLRTWGFAHRVARAMSATEDSLDAGSLPTLSPEYLFGCLDDRKAQAVFADLSFKASDGGTTDPSANCSVQVDCSGDSLIAMPELAFKIGNASRTLPSRLLEEAGRIADVEKPEMSPAGSSSLLPSSIFKGRLARKIAFRRWRQISLGIPEVEDGQADFRLIVRRLKLDDNEEKAVTLKAAGLTNKAIASQIGIDEDKVGTVLRRLRRDYPSLAPYIGNLPPGRRQTRS